MKTNLLRMLVILLGIIFISSCKKEESPAQAPAPAHAETLNFSCKINGVLYSSTTFAYFDDEGYLRICLPFSAETIVGLETEGAVGTYTLDTLYNKGSFYLSDEFYSTSFPGGSGTIVISKLTSTEVSGTFNFIAKAAYGARTVKLTEGKFTKVPHVL